MLLPLCPSRTHALHSPSMGRSAGQWWWAPSSHASAPAPLCPELLFCSISWTATQPGCFCHATPLTEPLCLYFISGEPAKDRPGLWTSSFVLLSQAAHLCSTIKGLPWIICALTCTYTCMGLGSLCRGQLKFLVEIFLADCHCHITDASSVHYVDGRKQWSLNFVQIFPELGSIRALIWVQAGC